MTRRVKVLVHQPMTQACFPETHIKKLNWLHAFVISALLQEGRKWKQFPGSLWASQPGVHSAAAETGDPASTKQKGRSSSPKLSSDLHYCAMAYNAHTVFFFNEQVLVRYVCGSLSLYSCSYSQGITSLCTGFLSYPLIVTVHLSPQQPLIPSTAL